MRNREDWKQVTAFSCKGNTPLPSQLLLQNRYSALGMADKGHKETEEEEPVQVLSPRSLLYKSCTVTNVDKNQWPVMVS